MGGIFGHRREGFVVDHLGSSGEEGTLPNRLSLLFRGGGEGCTVVHVGRDVNRRFLAHAGTSGP